MTVSLEELRPHLQGFNFPRLFVEGLGWNHYQAEPLAVQVNEEEYLLKPVAEKASFVVYECTSSVDNNIPPYPVRRRIESQATKFAFEHLIIFVDPDHREQVWQWVRREAGKPAACREYAFSKGQSGDHVLQRIQSLFISLDEEASLNITSVASRVRAALDVEKVTKDFYKRFRTELTAFGDFIDGITVQGDRDWYASLMLNRMMFIYFVQKQGFFDSDTNYLLNRLEMVQAQSGDGRFQQFYHLFLLRLFHEGLSQPEAQRAPDLAALLGRVPFLNGGLFDIHDLERDYHIFIPDEAFERIFAFFEDYRWHLDERPYREDKEINPDVIGYIFEKYINQKQMGAYYTKEDITGYISRNTVIPFLFDTAKKECPVAFGPDGGVWVLLQEDPDRYIYPAVSHGITWNIRQTEDPERLDTPFELPDAIAGGISDVAQRGSWNHPAPANYALPTETWREVVARRQHYADIRAKLAAGEVDSINELITLNLNIELFAKDVIVQSQGPELLRAFWQAMRDMSILDPTCGSGAFLFAALNVLEPLYTACLEGMKGFLDDLERTKRPVAPGTLSDFSGVREQVGKHPSERYFILKSIVLNNLYGVDLMEEAVEICKLRLFLKLVAQLKSYDQIEPLPDIDFNVRAGNTLVGFTSLDAVREAMTITPSGQHRPMFPEDEAALERIKKRSEEASQAFDRFRELQNLLGGEVTTADKQILRNHFRNLEDELDRHLATEYGVDPGKPTAYGAWRTSHQPFHWFVEFHSIMNRGGFDVVIGNPPYVEYKKVKTTYTIKGYQTETCGNLYAFVLERCKALVHSRSALSMIVPLSGHSTQRMQPLVQSFYEHYDSCHLFNISADAHPSVLFNGVKFRLAIFVVSNLGNGLFTTGYHRWYAEQRDNLFDLLAYTNIKHLRHETAIPKISGLLHLRVLKKIFDIDFRIQHALRVKDRSTRSIYYHTTPVNWIRSHSTPPYFRSDRDGVKVPNGLKTIELGPEASRDIQGILSSTVFFIWWLTVSDCYHLNKPEVLTFPMCQDKELKALSRQLETDMQAKTRRRVYNYQTTGRVEYDEFYMKLSKPIIDKIDRVLAQHYGFTEEEMDFIVNYDIKYRMGRDR